MFDLSLIIMKWSSHDFFEQTFFGFFIINIGYTKTSFANIHIRYNPVLREYIVFFKYAAWGLPNQNEANSLHPLQHSYTIMLPKVYIYLGIYMYVH